MADMAKSLAAVQVHESCELVPEVRDDKVRTEVIDNIDNVKKISNDFNPEVRGSLRLKGHKELEERMGKEYSHASEQC